MPGLAAVHLEPTPNDRDPVGDMAAPTDHAPIQNAQVRLPPHFCELRVRGREHHAAIEHFAIAHSE